MANVNVRNLPDEVHRGYPNPGRPPRPQHRGRIRNILERAAKPEGREKLGSLLASIGREAGGLSDGEHALIERARITSPARAASLE